MEQKNFHGSFDEYYSNILFITKDDSRPLTTKEFYSSLNDMGISNNKYHKIKQNYYNDYL